MLSISCSCHWLFCDSVGCSCDLSSLLCCYSVVHAPVACLGMVLTMTKAHERTSAWTGLPFLSTVPTATPSRIA
jgi:hypothetical protein